MGDCGTALMSGQHTTGAMPAMPGTPLLALLRPTPPLTLSAYGDHGTASPLSWVGMEMARAMRQEEGAAASEPLEPVTELTSVEAV